jgi:hypothetical protein
VRVISTKPRSTASTSPGRSERYLFLSKSHHVNCSIRVTYVLVFSQDKILHAAEKPQHSGISEYIAALGLQELHPLESHFAPIPRRAFSPRCTFVQMNVYQTASFPRPQTSRDLSKFRCDEPSGSGRGRHHTTSLLSVRFTLKGTALICTAKPRLHVHPVCSKILQICLSSPRTTPAVDRYPLSHQFGRDPAEYREPADTKLTADIRGTGDLVFSCAPGCVCRVVY